MPIINDIQIFKDKQFIRWQLAPDEELEAQWKDFIKENPHLHIEIQRAIDYLKTTGLNKSTLNEDERIRLFNEIQFNIKQSLKKQKSAGLSNSPLLHVPLSPCLLLD